LSYVIGHQPLEVSGVNVSMIFTLAFPSDTNNYIVAFAKSFAAEGGFEVDMEPVIGSNTPVVNYGVFQGTLEFSGIYSTDYTNTPAAVGTVNSQILNWLNQVSGAGVPLSLVMTFGDIENPQIERTLTFAAGSIWGFKWKIAPDNTKAVMQTLSCKLSAMPTMS
jgi:hypothetical protein